VTYYDELEVSPEASADVIRSAHRSLLIRFHPDRNPGNNEAELRVRRINEAYSVLSDENQRRAYDQQIGVAARSSRRPRPSQGPPGSDPGAADEAHGDGPTALPAKRKVSRPFALVLLGMCVVAVVMWVTAARTMKKTARETAEQAALLSAVASARPELSLDDQLTIANACVRFKKKADAEGLRRCKEEQLAVAASSKPPNFDGVAPDLVEQARRACAAFQMHGDLAGHRECFKSKLGAPP
jgi:curved DNA-binding protein CbpA